jgi:hypothetical protein
MAYPFFFEFVFFFARWTATFTVFAVVPIN